MNEMISRMKIIKQGGFSLLEMTVVVAILMMLIGWAVPNFNRYLLRIKLQNSTREVTTILRRSARHAMTKKQTVHVWVKTYNATGSSPHTPADPKNSIRAMVDTNIRSTADNWVDLSEGYCEMIVPVNIQAYSGWLSGAASPSSTDFEFTYYGTAQGGTLWVTYLQSDESGWMTVEPTTDYVGRVWYNTVTVTGLQRVRHYTYVRDP